MATTNKTAAMAAMAQALETQATMPMPTTTEALRDRIEQLRFFDIASLARDVKGSPLGFDINRKFAGPEGQKGGNKARFAEWCVVELSHTHLLKALPEYEETARAYYAKQGKRPPQAKPQIENVPIPGEPSKAPETPFTGNAQQILDTAQAKAAAMDTVREQMMKQHVAQEIAHGLAQARPIIVTGNNGGTINTTMLGAQHHSFDRLLKLCAVRTARGFSLNIWMTGPAGSGKTTAAENVAKALSLDFHFTGAVDNEYKLMGFIDANGKCIRTAFREAYEHGGIFLLDEVDGCHPAALLALNAALANGQCDFPDTKIARHKDCVIVAAANTWGTGATHEYVGRAKLDSASLDRFVMLAWDYDEALERNTSGNIEWAKKIQAIRTAVKLHSIKHIVSPRATYDGAALLANGFPEAHVLEMLVRKGLPDEQWRKVLSAVR